jgi:hypothetical protein
MTLKGSLGPDFMRWFSRALSLPDEVKLRPLNFSKSRIHWIQKGQKTLSASLALETGLELTTTVSLSDDGFNIKKLSIQDRASKAEAALTYKPQLIDLTYNGHLAHSTLDQLIVENSLLNGWIEGHIHTRIDTRNNFKLTLEGQMEGQKVRLPVNSPSPVWLNAFSLRGDPSNIIVESVDVAWNGSQIRVSGKFSPRIHHQLWMDAEINADAIDIDPLLSAARKQKQAAAKIDTTASPLSQVRGSLRFKADRFTVHGFTWSPLQLNIQLREDAAHITSQEAVICGIATPGTVTLSPQAAQFDIQPSANGQKLSATLNCLLGDQIKAEGTYSLKAHLQGEGRTQKVWQTAHGHIEYLSQQGRIYRDVLVSNTLDHVHAQKQLKGQKPSLQMDKQGLSYNSAWTKAKLQQGELVIEEMVLVTDSLDIVGQGKFNPKNKHVDMELLVAPVKTLNRALGYVPVIGGILQSLDVVAVGIKGPYDKIQTTPLAPSAVGYQLKTLLKNTLKAPMNIVPKSRTDRSKTIDTP